MARWLLMVVAIAWPAWAGAQDTSNADRVMAVVRAALTPALPFPDTDDIGSLPANGSPVPLWMVRPWQPGERTIEVMANPLNSLNQAHAARAMAQIDELIQAAQRRAERQYEQAIADAKRTGRSQDVDGVGLSDEGVAGARIDAEGHVSIDVDFNQPSYSYTVESSVAPAVAAQAGPVGVAVVGVRSNVYRVKSGPRTEERYCPAETVLFFGALATPEVRERSEHTFEIVASGMAAPAGSVVRTLTVRLRGNEDLIASIVATADWGRVQELLK